MNTQTGLVIIDFTKCDELIRSEIERAMEVTPTGRVLAAIYDLPSGWGPSYPWESAISSLVLRDPSHRDHEPEWQILSTLAIRCCKVGGKTRKVTRELGVVLFARQGPKAYKRRGFASKKILDSSRIATLHPAFTRDVANNVWHLSASNPIAEIKERLTGLLTWSDESTFSYRKGRKSITGHSTLNLNDSLIGVPTKINYEWQM